MLVSMDGREHTRLRRLISAGFTPRMVRSLDEQARRWAASIVDAALERGTCDFVQEVAYQLPMNMIADIVGIPVEDPSRYSRDGRLPERRRSRAHEGGVDAQMQMFEYAQQLGHRKRANRIGRRLDDPLDGRSRDRRWHAHGAR